MKILESRGEGKFAAEVLAIGKGTESEIPNLRVEDIAAIYEFELQYSDFDY